MDQLETQVSDLRSFLDPNATNANGTAASGTTAAPALLSTPQPPHPGAGPPPFHAPGSSILSAPYGDNSAHNSPNAISPPHHHHNHHHAHHHSQNLTSTSSRATASSSSNSNTAAATTGNKSKRQASEAALSDDGAPGSASGKQQRAKRNRVCFDYLPQLLTPRLYICGHLLTIHRRDRPLDHSTSQLLGNYTLSSWRMDMHPSVLPPPFSILRHHLPSCLRDFSVLTCAFHITNSSY